MLSVHSGVSGWGVWPVHPDSGTSERRVDCHRCLLRSCLGLTSRSGEHCSLRWETQYLSTLGSRFERWLAESVVQSTALQLAAAGGGSFVAGAISAFAWPAALLVPLPSRFRLTASQGSAALIDNAWSMGLAGAEKAGQALAEVLYERVHGLRPISLMGFSLGARVIFFALEALAQLGGKGIVANAVLLGAAAPSDAVRWANIREVCAGRVVNGYSSRDWVLGFMYRISSGREACEIAGLHRVAVDGVENVDLSRLVTKHTDYGPALIQILGELELGDASIRQRDSDVLLEPSGILPEPAKIAQPPDEPPEAPCDHQQTKEPMEEIFDQLWVDSD